LLETKALRDPVLAPFCQEQKTPDAFAEIRKHREGYPMLQMILSTGLALAIGVTIHADMAAARARDPR
jgi:hypothetical protein